MYIYISYIYIFQILTFIYTLYKHKFNIYTYIYIHQYIYIFTYIHIFIYTHCLVPRRTAPTPAVPAEPWRWRCWRSRRELRIWQKAAEETKERAKSNKKLHLTDKNVDLTTKFGD